MRVAYIHADKPFEWNSAYWRCVAFVEALNRTRHHSGVLGRIQDFSEQNQESHHVCADADVIVLQRGAMPDTWPAVRYWQARGKLLVADIDDGYPQITPEHPAYNFWHTGLVNGPDGKPVKMPRPAIYEMYDGLRLIGNITSPSKLVLWDWKQRLGVRGAHVPNYLRANDYRGQRTRSPQTDGTTWLAWGGSASHLVSFLESGISDALARVLADRPAARFVMCGADTRILDRIPLKTHQKINLAWRPFERWSEMLANFDIGLIPTAGEFEARRSTLKPLEYSMMRIPWIASHNPAYTDLAHCGTFVDNTSDAWAAALEWALDNPPDTPQLDAAQAYARSFDIDANIDNIIAAYESLRKESNV